MVPNTWCQKQNKNHTTRLVLVPELPKYTRIQPRQPQQRYHHHTDTSECRHHRPGRPAGKTRVPNDHDDRSIGSNGLLSLSDCTLLSAGSRKRGCYRIIEKTKKSAVSVMKMYFTVYRFIFLLKRSLPQTASVAYYLLRGGKPALSARCSHSLYNTRCGYCVLRRTIRQTGGVYFYKRHTLFLLCVATYTERCPPLTSPPLHPYPKDALPFVLG